MRTKGIIILALCSVIAACREDNYAGREPGLRLDSLDISEVVVALPNLDGRELVEMSCVPCHSLRYIEMQPEMSRKAWDKIVVKMIKNFGAPVRDSVTAAAIVDYLVRIKGIGQKNSY